MGESANLLVHPSQFPEAVWKQLAESLREKRIDHKFHYQTYKQTQLWLRIHHAYSPAQTDQHTAEIYKQAFEWFASSSEKGRWDIVSLGCGSGAKDAVLLSKLAQRSASVTYTPVDVGVGLLIQALQMAREFKGVLSPAGPQGLVCDLSRTPDLQAVLSESFQLQGRRLYLFFGMTPNFEPETMLRILRSCLRPGDLILMSANLSPGLDYKAGVQKVFPLYNNSETSEWLFSFMQDFGIAPEDGKIAWEIVPDNGSLLRIQATFVWNRSVEIAYQNESFRFQTGDKMQLFYSYRYSPIQIRALLAGAQLSVEREWISPSGEEGVFAVSG